MMKEKFDRSSPHVNIGTIGNIETSKLALSRAIMNTLGSGVSDQDDNIIIKTTETSKNKYGLTQDQIDHLSTLNPKDKKKYLKLITEG